MNILRSGMLVKERKAIATPINTREMIKSAGVFCRRDFISIKI
jgi:hypothetical protein